MEVVVRAFTALQLRFQSLAHDPRHPAGPLSFVPRFRLVTQNQPARNESTGATVREGGRFREEAVQLQSADHAGGKGRRGRPAIQFEFARVRWKRRGCAVETYFIYLLSTTASASKKSTRKIDISTRQVLPWTASATMRTATGCPAPSPSLACHDGGLPAAAATFGPSRLSPTCRSSSRRRDRCYSRWPRR